jgi:hypothetical protein
MIRWVPVRALHGDSSDRALRIARLTQVRPLLAGDWNNPFMLLLLGGVLLVVGVVLARITRDARARRTRDRR